MTELEFVNRLENGWDDAIKDVLIYAEEECDNNILTLCRIYLMAYSTNDYIFSKDPDAGTCFDIREFVIQEIIKLLILRKEKNNV